MSDCFGTSLDGARTNATLASHMPVLNATNELFMHCDNRGWNRRHVVPELAGKMTSIPTWRMPQPSKEFWKKGGRGHGRPV